VRVAFVGGTKFVGPVSVRALVNAGHEVVVAHSGAHEAEGLEHVEHLHGSRTELLAADGRVERWRPEVFVDTFAGGATAEKAAALGSCAARAGAAQIVAMEGALHGAASITVLRPGAIYAPYPRAREAFLVERIARGKTTLRLPDGGVQLWHRVAAERVANAIVAALERAPAGVWACNVVDPYDWDFSGLAARVAELLDWQWQPQHVSFSNEDHPWQTSHPVLASDRRLREVLEVTEPDPEAALAETVQWLWQRRGV
jgi:nucleoside-diphosphate-sugar epimerase